MKTFSLKPAARAALLAALSCGALQASAQALQSVVSFGQDLFGPYNPLTLTDPRLVTGADGQLSAVSNSGSSVFFSGFDATQGVLVGANLSLRVADAANLLLRTTSTTQGQLSPVASSLSAGWQILRDASVLQPSQSSTPLIQYLNLNHDTGGVVDSTAWDLLGWSMGLSNTDLNGLVGGQVESRVASTLEVHRTNSDKTNGSMSAYLAKLSDPSAQYGALTGDVTYFFKNHAGASTLFDGTASNEVVLSDTRLSSLLSLVASGQDSDTTGLDFSAATADIDCSGDCDRFSLGLSAISDLLAGSEQEAGTVSLLGAAGDYLAHYTLRFADTASEGASSTRQWHTVAFDVRSTGSSPVVDPPPPPPPPPQEVPPNDPPASVPEPQSALLALAGLGLMAAGNRARQRRGQ